MYGGQFEMSSFAVLLPSRACRHNKTFWRHCMSLMKWSGATWICIMTTNNCNRIWKNKKRRFQWFWICDDGGRAAFARHVWQQFWWLIVKIMISYVHCSSDVILSVPILRKNHISAALKKEVAKPDPTTRKTHGTRHWERRTLLFFATRRLVLVRSSWEYSVYESRTSHKEV